MGSIFSVHVKGREGSRSLHELRAVLGSHALSKVALVSMAARTAKNHKRSGFCEHGYSLMVLEIRVKVGVKVLGGSGRGPGFQACN